MREREERSSRETAPKQRQAISADVKKPKHSSKRRKKRTISR